MHAVIRGTAINNDGHSKAGFSAPSIEGQANVILECQAVSGVSAESIGYVEAHGTGTRVGDPIEVTALTKAFRSGTARNAFCGLSSVKPNIGHLDAAAGIAGLIKAALVVKYGEIPPMVGYSEPNLEIDFARTPFYVNTVLKKWEVGQTHSRRIAAVSSFGIGGTNAHAIVEEPPLHEPIQPCRTHQLLVLSARTPDALRIGSDQLADAMSAESAHASLVDAAYTLALGRRAFEHRRYVVCTSQGDAVAVLRSRTAGESVAQRDCRPVFMFPGQGSRMISTGRELYANEPIFAEALNRCAKLLSALDGTTLLETLFAPNNPGEQYARWLDRADIAQVAHFSLQYALAQLWMNWGLQPAALIGHSLGEYVAACLAGVFTLEDALQVVARRGHLMQQLEHGRMLAVMLSESDVLHVMPGELSLAAVNGPQSCVVSGPEASIVKFEQSMRERNVRCTMLQTTLAFHSRMMAPAAAALEDFIRSVPRRAPRIPLIAGTQGSWLSAAEVTEPQYWSRHMLGTIRFADGIRLIAEQGVVTLLEVGWGPTLCTLARQILDHVVAVSSITSHATGRGEVRDVLEAAGRLWASGVEIDWNAFYGGRSHQRISLPGYPFARDRHWLDPNPSTMSSVTAEAIKSPSPKQSDAATWFRQPAWRRSSHVTGAPATTSFQERWLIFADKQGVANAVAARLEKRGHRVVLIEPGAELDLTQQSDYDSLLRKLDERGESPTRVAHFWSVRTTPLHGSTESVSSDEVNAGYRSALYLLQALMRRTSFTRTLWLVSAAAHDVVGNESIVPERSMLLGLCRVASQESPSLLCRCLDLPALESEDAASSNAAIDRELTSDPDDTLIALRAGQRWILDFYPIAVPANANTRLHRGGVYLITGGLGRFGMVIARYLARKYEATVVLTTRDLSLAPVTEHSDPARRARSHALQELKQSGACVEILQADAGNFEQTSELVRAVLARHGAIHGVIHAAGIIGDITHRSISETDDEHNQLMFHAKVSGVLALRSALQGIDVGFVMLVSSLSPILGGLGLAAYAAANQFMDAFVSKQRHIGDGAWLSVNWEGWAREERQDVTSNLGAQLAHLTMTESEIEECFERALSLGGLHRMTIATGELSGRMRRWSTASGLVKLSGAQNDASRQDHAGDPAGAIRVVAQSLLGISDLGDDEDLIERGANSLTAIQLIGRIRELFGVDLPMRALFERPTVSGLAWAVAVRTGAATAELLEVLEEVEGIDEDDVDAVLHRERDAREATA
ncbi:MAG: SDR family NAD(P)-dependent oxidoreductase [Pseudomonadota bacterium]|nr:SDR family NAD(P)-dependent oxidoreductase [Pseudomonadota bacterium]